MSVVGTRAVCRCGSGRPAAACHEGPRRETRRRRRELYVLAEAHDLAALFPEVRPRDAVFAAYADSAAAELGGGIVPVDAVEQGLALLGEPERRRLVDSWVERYPDRWRALLDDGGRGAPLERAVVAGAVEMAIAERLPVPRELLARFEGGLLRASPVDAVVLVVPPLAVWSMDEAVTAAASAPAGAAFDDAFALVERLALTCVGPEHLERLRVVADRIAARLPQPGLPRASATVAEGCALLRDDAWCRPAAARLLGVYATSPAVERERAAQRRPRPRR